MREGWIVRSSWLFGWTGKNFVRTMLALGEQQDEVSVVDDQRGSPTYVGHLAEATPELLELPRGVWHLAAEGDCTWAEFAEAIFEEAGPRLPSPPDHEPRSSVARRRGRPTRSSAASTQKRPRLPHWREGLRACLARL